MPSIGQCALALGASRERGSIEIGTPATPGSERHCRALFGVRKAAIEAAWAQLVGEAQWHSDASGLRERRALVLPGLPSLERVPGQPAGPHSSRECAPPQHTSRPRHSGRPMRPSLPSTPQGPPGRALLRA